MRFITSSITLKFISSASWVLSFTTLHFSLLLSIFWMSKCNSSLSVSSSSSCNTSWGLLCYFSCPIRALCFSFLVAFFTSFMHWLSLALLLTFIHYCWFFLVCLFSSSDLFWSILSSPLSTFFLECVSLLFNFPAKFDMAFYSISSKGEAIRFSIKPNLIFCSYANLSMNQ